MKTIKSIIIKYLQIIAVIMALFLIFMICLFQIAHEHQLTRNSTKAIFTQIEKLLDENTKELERVRDEYSEECLKNAETIAYIVENNPDILNDLEQLRHIAYIANVDEVHFFDKEGRIFNGTHPQYYNMTVDDGEQIGFFKQMLYDKDLKLVQPITPNTADGSMIQYSAVWSHNGDFFVQVGMKQANVLKVTEKNELSYIFSLLKVNSSVDLYAADPDSGEIIGSTDNELEGKTLSDIGISLDTAENHPEGFYTTVNGKLSFCMFEKRGENLIGRTVLVENMYSGIIADTVMLSLGIIFTTVIMVIAITRFIKKDVITGIDNINEKLSQISGGNLDERVSVTNCVEFNELSNHINDMIASILASTDKMSYVIDRANLQIGVYEYNEKMKSVRFTKKVQKILSLTDSEVERLSGDCNLFKEYLEACFFDNVSEEENIFRLYGETEKYVKYEEFSSNNSILGIIMDITEDYNRRKQLEIDRDIDSLTGLLNRRGLDSRLESMFRHPQNLGYGALVMIDADGLKTVNDSYGHNAGDIYLKEIAHALSSLGSKKCFCARQGGDEFVILLHNLESEEQVNTYIERLTDLQSKWSAEITEGKNIPIKFSLGVTLLDGTSDYKSLLMKADDKMYSNKRNRKMSNKKAD